MNAYASLGLAKGGMKINGTNDDVAIAALIVDVSRAIDEVCDRRFYAELATRYYDGDGGPELYVNDDILSVTTMKLDTDGDNVYERTLTADTDYWLAPYNYTPKRQIIINPRSTLVSYFPQRRRSLQIVGMFGYSYQLDAGAVANGAATDSATSITVDAGHGLTGCEMLVTASGEQIYVSTAAATTLTVVRAQNGTTAAAIGDNEVLSLVRIDELIRRACVMQVARFRRDGQSGGANAASSSDFGGFSVASMYPAIREMLQARKMQAIR